MALQCKLHYHMRMTKAPKQPTQKNLNKIKSKQSNGS
jgi:hypothetical protein